MSRKKQVFEVCAMCGTVAEGSSIKKEFKCRKCGCNVAIVLSRAVFAELAKKTGKR